MAILMRTPAQSEAFFGVTKELHLRVDMTCGYAGMLRPVPDHNPTVRAHGCDDIRVLRLISCLIDFPFVIDFLHDIELNLHRSFLCGASTVAANLFPFIVIIGSVGADRIRQLTVDNL